MYETNRLAAGLGLAAATYAGYVNLAWYRYGDSPRPRPEEQDALVDSFMPEYEVVERHHIHGPGRRTSRSVRTPGAGGSLRFADPKAGIGYGYVMSQMGTALTGDPRDVALRNALYSGIQIEQVKAA